MKLIFTLILYSAVPVALFSQTRNYSGVKIPSLKQANNYFILESKISSFQKVKHKPVVDLSDGLPNPGDQGPIQGSCAAWASCYGLMTFLQFRLKRWPLKMPDNTINKQHVYSPSYVYNQLNESQDCKSGVFIDSVLRFLQFAGTVPLSVYDYDPNSCQKPAEQTNKIQKTTILTYYQIYNYWNDTLSQVDTSVIKNQLNLLSPLVLGIHIDSTFENNNYGDRKDINKPFIWDKFFPCSIDSNYHAVLCVGYNDTLKAFKLLNSWGISSFGNGGYIWVSYNIFKAVVKEAYYAVNNQENIKLNLSRNFFKENQESFETPIPESALRKRTKASLMAGQCLSFGRFKITCLSIYNDKKTAVFKINDTKGSNSIIVELKSNSSNSFKKFKYKGLKIAIYITRITSNDISNKVRVHFLY